MKLTYDEIVDILDVKDIAGSNIEYTLPRRIYEFSDINLTLKSLLPINIKTSFTKDYVRLRSNLTNNKTIRFTENSLFIPY